MEHSTFDRITKLFAERRLNRRTVIQGSAATAAGLSLGMTASSITQAQQATPVAESGGKTEFLFVQSFDSGDLSTGSNGEAAYTLTLNAGLGETLFFSDRPERIVGTVPTPQFLDKLGFSSDNPPNAALVAENTRGDVDILVVELFDPQYDDASHTATYGVNVLADDAEVDMQFTEDALARPEPTTYTGAHLFIDDCADETYCCKTSDGSRAGFITVGRCWSWSKFDCLDCHNYDGACNDAYPDACQGSCTYDQC